MHWVQLRRDDNEADSSEKIKHKTRKKRDGHDMDAEKEEDARKEKKMGRQKRKSCASKSKQNENMLKNQTIENLIKNGASCLSNNITHFITLQGNQPIANKIQLLWSQA